MPPARVAGALTQAFARAQNLAEMFGELLDLVGYAPADLERFPTRGSASNTIAIFPRGYVRPMRGLEVYAGPLMVFAPSVPTDPFNTKMAGGESRNALDGDPSHYLGTEVDLGARFRMLMGGTELTLGVEGGLFIPGAGLQDKAGDSMDLVYGGRIMLGYRL